MQNLQASKTPLEAIEAVSYPGQEAHMKMYRSGYEKYFNEMPVLVSPFLEDRVKYAGFIAGNLGKVLRLAPWVSQDNFPGRFGFNRTILAIEDKVNGKEGAEFIVARWGDGRTSPIHGHAAGYLYENLIFGKLRVNTYRITETGAVRIVRTDIISEPGEFAAIFTKAGVDEHGRRTTLVHNFTSIGNSATLHFVPEHTRDGRDNRYELESFNVEAKDVFQVDPRVIDMQVGDVFAVSSSNVTDLEEHFIIITGPKVQKPWGLRHQDIAFYAPQLKELLYEADPTNGVKLLKLRPTAAKAFINFHNLSL